MSRAVVWFSAGAASAVAAKLTLADGPAELVYTDPGSEHPDNQRFIADCETWFGQSVIQLKSEKFSDTWDVWEKRRFLVGPTGALCTVELKKRQRFAFQRPDDIQVFGYTVDEAHRADRFREQNPGVDLRTPLIERGLTKADCLAIVDRAGIELPAMYRLGFRNANCVGCPKGGKGYWNRIRRVFPETFDRMASLERSLDASIFRSDDGPLWLDTLDPKAGRDDEPEIECSLLCVLAEDDFAIKEALDESMRPSESWPVVLGLPLHAVRREHRGSRSVLAALVVAADGRHAMSDITPDALRNLAYLVQHDAGRYATPEHYYAAADRIEALTAERDEAVARASMMLDHSQFVECGQIGCTYHAEDYLRDASEWAHRYQTSRQEAEG